MKTKIIHCLYKTTPFPLRGKVGQYTVVRGRECFIGLSVLLFYNVLYRYRVIVIGNYFYDLFTEISRPCPTLCTVVM